MVVHQCISTTTAFRNIRHYCYSFEVIQPFLISFVKERVLDKYAPSLPTIHIVKNYSKIQKSVRAKTH